AELLDHAEEVVPAARVEPHRVVAKLMEDLLHLEGREDRLHEDGRLERAVGRAEALLAEGEDLVPEARLQVALHLGEVEGRRLPLGEQPARVVEGEEAEVDEAAARSEEHTSELQSR